MCTRQTGNGTGHGMEGAHVLSDVPSMRMKSRCVLPHIPSAVTSDGPGIMMREAGKESCNE